MIRIFLFYFILSYFSFALADTEPLNKLAQYLDGMDSIAAVFNQRDSKGDHAKGILLIHKPHRFRCNYFAPAPLLIVGNTDYITVYDYEMETKSRINANENIFNFLVVNRSDLLSHFNLTLLENSEHLLKVKLYHVESGKESVISFDPLNKQLKEIQVFEGDNIITVNIEKIYQVAHFDKDLFSITGTTNSAPPPQLNERSLMQKFSIKN